MKIIYFAFFLSVFFFACQKSNQHSEILHQKESIVTYTLVNMEDGWGYKIFSGGSLYVEQLIIPGARGNQKFKTPKQAEDVALLMIKKMENGIFPPSVEVAELDSLKIEYVH